MKKIIYFIVIILLAVIALVLSSQNDQFVELNYMLAKQELVLSQALALFFLIGAIIASLGWWLFLAKAKLRFYQQKSKIKQLTNENEYLRIQLKDQ